MPTKEASQVSNDRAGDVASGTPIEESGVFLSVNEAWIIWLDDWMEYQANFGTGLDERIRSAHLITFYAHQLALMVATRVLAGEEIPDIDPARLRIGFMPYDAGEERPAGARRFCFRASGVADHADLHDCFVESLRPVVDALSSRGNLSRGSLWRLASDGIAGAFLETGRMVCQEERAMNMALAILEKDTSPFHSGALRFESISGADGVVRTHRIRSGCCLIYKANGGRHCDVCVLLTADERYKRLAALNSA